MCMQPWFCPNVMGQCPLRSAVEYDAWFFNHRIQFPKEEVKMGGEPFLSDLSTWSYNISQLLPLIAELPTVQLDHTLRWAGPKAQVLFGERKEGIQKQLFIRSEIPRQAR